MPINGKCQEPRGTVAAERHPGPVADQDDRRFTVSPDDCRHGSVRRLGIQKADVWPHRLHLVTCAGCGTTLTTESLRAQRRRERSPRKSGFSLPS